MLDDYNVCRGAPRSNQLVDRREMNKNKIKGIKDKYKCGIRRNNLWYDGVVVLTVVISMVCVAWVEHGLDRGLLEGRIIIPTHRHRGLI